MMRTNKSIYALLFTPQNPSYAFYLHNKTHYTPFNKKGRYGPFMMLMPFA